MNGNQEMDRILRLVEEGKVSPAEGERLIASLEARQQTMRCPYCAESIPAGLNVCPECATPLAAASFAPPAARPASRGLSHLSGLGKVLVVYTFIVTAIVILTNLSVIMSPAGIFRTGLAVLGVAAAVLICKGRSVGWGLAMLWSGLQIVRITLGGYVLNQQGLAFSFNYSSNGSGFGINFLGILLLVLFIVASRERRGDLAERTRTDGYVREVTR